MQNNALARWYKQKKRWLGDRSRTMRKLGDTKRATSHILRVTDKAQARVTDKVRMNVIVTDKCVWLSRHNTCSTLRMSEHWSMKSTACVKINLLQLSMITASIVKLTTTGLLGLE